MFAIKSQDRDFLLKNVPGIEKVLEEGSKRDIQDSFYEWMDLNCWDVTGELIQPIADKAQDVWDSIRETEE